MFLEQPEVNFDFNYSGKLNLDSSAPTFGLHIVFCTWTHPFEGQAQFIRLGFFLCMLKDSTKADSLLFLPASLSAAQKKATTQAAMNRFGKAALQE